MSFDPLAYVQLGRELARESTRSRSPTREARVRNAFGRLYYGLFLTVREALVHRHGIRRDVIRHGAVCNHLQHSSLKTEAREVGRELQRLYELRRKADCELAPPSPWDTQLQDAGHAQILAGRAVEFAQRVPYLDFTPVVHLFQR